MSTTIAAEAFATIPGYKQNTAAQDRVEARIRELRGWKRPASLDSRDVADIALRGEALPEDAAQSEARVVEQALAIGAEQRLYNSALKDLQSRAKTLMTNHAPAALAVIQRHLDRIQAEVIEHASVLGRAHTEAEAYKTQDQNVIDAWTAVGGLTGQYQEARSAQMSLYGASVASERKPDLPSVALYADSLDVLASWQRKRRAANDSTVAGAPEVLAFCDWLKAPAGVSVADQPNLASLLSPGELIDVCTHTRLWAPTLDTALELNGAARTIVVHRVEPSDLANREDARNRYYRLTKTTPATTYTDGARHGTPTTTSHARTRARL